MQPTNELVKLAKSGDQQCIAELIDRLEATVVSTAWSITGDFHLAQDVAQESLVTAFRNIAQLRDDDAFVPWLMKSVRRHAAKAAKRCRTETTGLELQNIANKGLPEWARGFDELLPLLNRLPSQQQTVVNLRFVAGMSTREIADTTGRPLGTVTKQLSRALATLRSRLIEVER